VGGREGDGDAVRDWGGGERRGGRGGLWFWVAGCVPGWRREIIDIEKGAGEEIPRSCFLMFDEGDMD
jgi:hypothetical protein